jgi:serine/threonine-protein kinase
MTVEVPDLIGRSLAEADRLLDKRGLYLKVEAEDYDLSIPKGHIISQNIPAGSHIKGQSEVKVVVSKGPKVYLIPSVIGNTLAEAKNLFLQKGLEISKVIYVHSDTVEKDRIIAQKPAPEEWTGGAVTLVVSKGPYNVIYYCPFFEGMLKEDALMLARELGLNVEIIGPIDTGRIIVSQKPKPGTEIKIGSTIYLKLKGD